MPNQDDRYTKEDGNQDLEYAQLLRNIEYMTQMIFDAHTKGSTSVPQFLLSNGKPDGFWRKDRLPHNLFSENDKIGDLKSLLKSGLGKITIHVQKDQIKLFEVEEKIQPVT